MTALTVAQLRRALADLPIDQQDLPVYTDDAGWIPVTGAHYRPAGTALNGSPTSPYVEIQTEL